MIQLRRVSAKITSSNAEVPPPRSRDSSSDQPQRYGASAYIDQSEYDSYKQSTINSSSQLSKTDGANRGAYYSSENTKNRYVQDQIDDDYTTNDYPVTQQPYTKTSSYNTVLTRSNSYNGAQPRVISAKQRNTSGSSLLYQVK